MDYDVTLSFAGEDREYVKAVAETLRERGVRVFYDEFEQATLWGKDLYTYLDYIYRFAARYCVIFVSKHYAGKVWPDHERASIQARALSEASEYVLPARFDATQVPGLRPTLGYVDLTEKTQQQLADLICEKLELPLPGTEIDKLPLRWLDPIRIEAISGSAHLRHYQRVPVGADLGVFGQVIVSTIRSLYSQMHQEGDRWFWTHHEDRRFDRIYATSSVATALAQLGVGSDNQMVTKSIGFLRDTSPSSIDDRAASVFLLIIGLLEAMDTLAFVEAIAEHQILDPDSDIRGSFLLPQGPSRPSSSTRGNWSVAPLHSDGASFHACHLAEAMLHIPVGYRSARQKAQQLLTRIRGFFVRTFQSNKGWLVDINGDRSPITVYSFALCPLLSVPLPGAWREIAETALNMLRGKRYDLITRSFGLMNAAYLSTSLQDSEFEKIAEEYARKTLESTLSESKVDSLCPRDIAALQRAVVYGLRLIDERLHVSVSQVAAAAVREMERQ